MKEVTDIEGRKVEVGDLILRPKFSVLCKSIVLGFTKNSIILSCARGQDTWVLSDLKKYKYVVVKYDDKYPILWKANKDINNHNSKQYIQCIPDVLILEKNCKLPEKLKKFIKND